MKILLLTITILCFTCTEAQIRFGVQGGYNHARFSSNQSSSNIFSYTTRGFRGFQAGAVAEMKVFDGWIFRPALLVTGKGATLEKTGFGNKSSRSIELHYLEVPLVVAHKWSVDKSTSAFA